MHSPRLFLLLKNVSSVATNYTDEETNEKSNKIMEFLLITFYVAFREECDVM